MSGFVFFCAVREQVAKSGSPQKKLEILQVQNGKMMEG